MQFDWDAHNLFHIEMHGLKREDVEYALLGDTVRIGRELRNGEDRLSQLGRDSHRRILFIVTVDRAGSTRPVTAYRANQIFRAVYRARYGDEA